MGEGLAGCGLRGCCSDVFIFIPSVFGEINLRMLVHALDLGLAWGLP